jgi:hypothetical protein
MRVVTTVYRKKNKNKNKYNIEIKKLARITALREELRVDFLEHLLVDYAARALLLETAVHDLNLLLAESRCLHKLFDGPWLVAHYLS